MTDEFQEIFSGILSRELPRRISKREDEVNKILSQYQLPKFKINFEQYFSKAQLHDVFIFPFLEKLYALIQKKSEVLERIGVLKWNRVDIYHQLFPVEENMIHRIPPTSPLYQICERFFPTFQLYEIPFYFIPLIRETFKPTQFGELTGNWRLIIHPALNLFQNPLPFSIDPPQFKLRNYQENALQSWHANNKFGTIALATAGGKTVCGIQAIYDLKLTTLIAVPTSTLMFQWRKDILQMLKINPLDVGLFYGKKHDFTPILIGTYDSLKTYISFGPEERQKLEIKYKDNPEKLRARMLKRERESQHLQYYYSFLIPDESHHIPAPTFRKVGLNSKALYRMALSATVERYDHNETLLYFASGQKIFELNYIDLSILGWVVPFIYRFIPIKLDTEQLEYYKGMVDLESRKQFSYFNLKKLNAVVNIAKAHSLAKHQMLIFTTHVNAAEVICATLQQNGIKADLVIGKQNQHRERKSAFLVEKDREKVIAAFAAKQLEAIVSTTVLDEGFNVPECSVGIIISGSSTSRQMIQRVGRIVRKSTLEKIAYIYEITTIGDNEITTVDEINRLVRNGMVIDVEQYRKKKETFPPEYWTFNYPEITKLALKRCRELKLSPIPSPIAEESV